MNKIKNTQLLTTIFTAVLISTMIIPAFAQESDTTTADQQQATPEINSDNFVISSGPRTIGLFPAFPYNTANILTAAGHTVINPVNLNVPITVDVLYLQRGGAGLSGAQLTNVQNFLANGGKVVTEFDATGMWFNTKLASLSGTLVNGFFVPSGSVLGGNLVTVVDTANPLSTALPPTWTSGDPIGVLKVYSGLDPSIKVAAKIKGTALGDVDVVGCTNVGKGTGVLFFSDFLDFNAPWAPEEAQLLLNAVAIDTCDRIIVGGELLPIDTTALLVAGAQTNAVWIISALAVIGSVAFGVLHLTTKRN